MKNKWYFSVFALCVVFFLRSVALAQPNPTPSDEVSQCMVRSDQTELCLHDRILDYRNATGFISQIYSNDTAVILYDDGSENMVDLQYVSREVQCLYGYCIGDQVLDPNDDAGTITDLFENGQAEISYSSGEVYFFSLDELTESDEPAVVITHDWYCRPYPDAFHQPWAFPSPPFIYPCPWPYQYPYVIPGFGVRFIIGVCPGIPSSGFGIHGHVNYPYPTHGYGNLIRGPRPLPYPSGIFPGGGIHGGPVGGGYHPPIGTPGPYYPPIHTGGNTTGGSGGTTGGHTTFGTTTGGGSGGTTGGHTTGGSGGSTSGRTTGGSTGGTTGGHTTFGTTTGGGSGGTTGGHTTGGSGGSTSGRSTFGTTSGEGSGGTSGGRTTGGSGGTSGEHSSGGTGGRTTDGHRVTEGSEN